MDLSEYMASGRGKCAGLARGLGISPAWLSQMASRRRPVPPLFGPKIERLSGHAIRRWDLRPDDWHQIWPELVGTPGAPAVNASEHEAAA